MSTITLSRPQLADAPRLRIVGSGAPETRSSQASPRRPAEHRTAARTTDAVSASSVRAPRLRITARGRAVLATLIAVPLAIGGVAVGLGQQAAAQSEPVPTSFDYVTVQPGESLWSIADDVAPRSDPREVVARIVDLNQLPSAELQAGQRIAVPAADAN